MSVCVYINIFIYIVLRVCYAYVYILPFNYLVIYLSICLSTLSMHRFIYLPIYLSISPSIHLSI